MNAFARIVDIAASYRTKSLSPVDVVKTFLKRIERLNPTINAFITVTPEAALAEARQAEAELN